MAQVSQSTSYPEFVANVEHYDVRYRRERWGGFVYDVRRLTRSVSIEGNVILVEGAWPTDEELYSLVDGTTPVHRRWFGGHIKGCPDGSKDVTVYTD